MSRFQFFFPVLILSVVLALLSACGSKSSPPGPTGNAQAPAVQSQQASPSSQNPPTPGQPGGGDPLLMEQGEKFMAIVNEYKQRLEKDPKDKEALMFLGNANYDINRFGQALDYYKRYLEIDPTHPGVRTDLATSYYNLKDVDSAVHELKAVLTQDPEREAALYNLGLLLWQEKKDNPGAIKAWESLLKVHPAHPKAEAIRKQIAEMKKKS